MIEVIEPHQFKTIPWKNGLGETTELAINEGASLDNFLWRLSIASVANDGIFSDFSGYDRNLVLISGKGINLYHDGKSVDMLENILDVASFDGSSKTQGQLVAGAIKDFNIITDNDKVVAQVNCYVEFQQVSIKLSKNRLCFAYSLTDDMMMSAFQAKNTTVPTGHLAKFTVSEDERVEQAEKISITGKNMIIVQLEIKDSEQ
ncbi:MAG: HutD family protein [Colwellia sp.]|nr:HutD family protein [Colwellia sp.]MCW8865833.1 HutD family protein [Colwellia sp.]MCW9082171.1 HutD family protein [Colwellia sp.]